MVILTDFTIDQNINGSGEFNLLGGLRSEIKPLTSKIYPRYQQRILKGVLNIINSSVSNIIEIGIKEVLSSTLYIPIIVAQLNINEVKNFNINVPIFFRTLDFDSNYYYAIYYNSSSDCVVKGHLSLILLNTLKTNVNY